MGGYSIELTDTAKADLKKIHKSGDMKSIKKIDKIMKDLSIHPTMGEGKPEELKYELSGFWSRQINKKDRLIYQINDNKISVLVVSALGHYSDK